MLNVLTVNVEEYFHPTEVQSRVRVDDWNVLPSRLEPEVFRILEMLARHHLSATFFIVGWIAERHPYVLREIVEAGHEIGCHGYSHRLIYELTPAEFKADTLRAMSAIQDACGVTPRIYRAPSYSITVTSMWALEVLIELGFTHDSSIYPISHDRYGIPGFGRHAQTLSTASGSILEVPIATVKFSNGKVAPVGGGGYLRLMPYRYTAAGIRQINQQEQQPACIYFHPWELDCDQPRLASGLISRLRTYAGLAGMASKLERLFSEFEFAGMSAVHPIPGVQKLIRMLPAKPARTATG